LIDIQRREGIPENHERDHHTVSLITITSDEETSLQLEQKSETYQRTATLRLQTPVPIPLTAALGAIT
jgi:hypothetical protein